MLDQSKIKSVANSSVTSKAIFNALSERERYRDQLDLRKFKNDLMNKGEKIVQDEYLETFKMLEDLGVGSLIIGRKGKPNRFKWNYNLKDVAKASMNNQTQIKTIAQSVTVSKRPRGRPRKNQSLLNAVSVKKTNEPISITINLPADSNPADVAALLSLVKDMTK